MIIEKTETDTDFKKIEKKSKTDIDQKSDIDLALIITAYCGIKHQRSLLMYFINSAILYPMNYSWTETACILFTNSIFCRMLIRVCFLQIITISGVEITVNKEISIPGTVYLDVFVRALNTDNYTGLCSFNVPNEYFVCAAECDEYTKANAVCSSECYQYR